MKGDFTRVTFDAANHYHAVRHQQGRVQLDSDLNEQADIGAHRQETLTVDVVGRSGAPIGDAGFAVSPLDGGLRVSAGRYYVDGILCENEADVSLAEQPDLIGGAPPAGADTQRIFLVYLDVWLRHLTALERPALREAALDGPDTATRERTVWQVRMLDTGDMADPHACSDFGAGWTPPGRASTGRMSARATPPPPPTEVCLVAATAGYRGLGNQLYRVEVHDGSESADGPTLKWSRDNAVVVAAIQDIDGNAILVGDAPTDPTYGFLPGQWVELTDEERVQNAQPGVLVRIDTVEGDALVVLAWPNDTPLTLADFGASPTVRRWDSPGALALRSDEWIELEQGVEVRFSAGDYRSGDFWWIPARTLTGGIEWPSDDAEPLALPRRGIAHHHAPLALVRFDGVAWVLVQDCRALCPPLTELTRMVYLGGNGQEAMPGDGLPQLLEVGVYNGSWPVPNATVRFSAEAAGRVAESLAALPASAVATIEVATDGDGVARCAWRLDPDTALPSQRLTAELLDDTATPAPGPIHFDGNLSLAGHVFYDVGDCAALAGRRTVQEAIDDLSREPAIHALSGDGQRVTPGAAMEPLRVVVGSLCGPVANAAVRFTVISGAGTVNGVAPSAEVATDGDGVAICAWQPDAGTPYQEVEASISPGGGAPPRSVRFGATVVAADTVPYDPEQCPAMAGAGVSTVAGALDFLCARPSGGGCAVTVGRGGQYATLAEAFADLLNAQRLTDIRICLLPGEHPVEGGLAIGETQDASTTRVTIEGGGRTARVRLRGEPIVVRGIARLELNGVGLVAEGVVRPLRIGECQEVYIVDCDLRQVSFFTTLLTIQNSGLLTITGSALASYSNLPDITLVTVPGLDMPALAPDTPVRAIPGILRRGAEQLASATPDQRKIAGDHLVAYVNDLPGGLPKEQADAIRAAATALPAMASGATAGPQAAARMAAVFPLFALAPAISLLDGRAQVSIADCDIAGDARLYGDTRALNLREMRELGARISNHAITLVDAGADLSVRDSRLTRIAVDAAVLGAIVNGEQLPGIHRRAAISGNLLRGVEQHWLARSVSLLSNLIDVEGMGERPLAFAFGQAVSAVAMATPDGQGMLMCGAPDQRVTLAANLMLVST
ncbi:MAG: hypothetical protein IT208_11585 [Chthonomonadales bacterium]|nr:hypothetical protein [Chthonomonadales bacterium]